MPEPAFPDGRMQKLMGKPWSSWNLPEQPTDLDLRKLKEAYQPPEQYRPDDHQSTPLPSKFLPLFGTHPHSDFLSITKCPACGWLLKIQHANQHFLRDSRGAIVCRDSDLAIFGSKVLGKAVYPLGDLKETWSRRVTLRLPPPSHTTTTKSFHSLRGTPSITEIVSKSRSGSGSHSNLKTDYLSHSSSQYRSRTHSQIYIPPPYMPKNRSGGTSTTSHGSISMNTSTSGSKGKSGKSHSSSTWSSSSLRSTSTSKSSSNLKTSHGTSGSYTLSIPSEDMGHNESVEDLLMSNMSQTLSTKHTVHIIATQNSSKSKSTEQDYDHHNKYYDVPEKRMKLDSSHSRSDHHHKSSMSHGDSHDSYSKSKSKHSSSSLLNGVSSDSNKKSKSSSSLVYSKTDLGSSSKHHLRSTASSTIVTISKPVVSVSSLSSSSHSRSHSSSIGSLCGSGSVAEKEREKEKTSPSKKKKRKRDKDEPRKIIPLKDRDFNPDKHCGVCPIGSSSPCKRSLTCKTHSIALRRAVNGRSQSFDALLAAHKLAKTEEKNLTLKEKEVIVEEIAPPKPKKKKLSGTGSTTASSPNDLGALGAISETTTYARTKSPDVEVVAIKPKPKVQPDIDHFHCYSKKIKQCPLVYPYKPETQAKFEDVWYHPETLERLNMTADEKHKFVFLLKHYKNPHFLNADTKPQPKNAREKRNVVRET